MKSVPVSVAFLLLLISPEQLQAQTWSAAEKEVLQALDECHVAYKEEDLEALMATCYHDDYVRFRYGAPTTFDKADVRKGTQIDWANSDVVEWWVKPLAIRIVGDVAIIHYYSYFRYRDEDGKETGGRNRFTDVWVKQEGKWLKIADHGGTDPVAGQ